MADGLGSPASAAGVDEGLDNASAPPTSGGLPVGVHKEARPRRLLAKRRRGGSSGEPATSEESPTRRSRRRPAPLRMDPGMSNVSEDSQEQFPGGNIGTYQPGWYPYMYGYGYQGPPGWLPQGFQPRPLNVAMMNPSGYAPEGFRPAQIPEACVQDSEAEVVEVAAPTRKKKNKNAGTRKKLGNFNPDEDKNLVKSWLEISCDPITSTGQKRDRMWERIIQRYNSRRASNPERSLRSLQSRWDTIRAEVTLFASYYADSIRENPSGMSNADKTTHAVGNFAAVLKRKFGFLHCWELMKVVPKWQDPNARDIATAARGEGFGEPSAAGTDTVEPAEGQSSPVRSGAQASRPMGRDSAKVAKKKANSDAGSTSSAEYAAKMQDLSLQKISIMQKDCVRRNDRFQQLASIDEKRFEEMRRHNEALLQIEQEKIRIMREQHEDARRKEEKKEDERILQIDLDACPPALRLYYQNCQEEILERQATRRRRSQAP